MGSGYEIARGIEQLIQLGHPPAFAWTYTPRKMMAWLELAERRKAGELSELLNIITVGQSGDRKGITKVLKQLRDQAE